jgi:hypothetical protein
MEITLPEKMLPAEKEIFCDLRKQNPFTKNFSKPLRFGYSFRKPRNPKTQKPRNPETQKSRNPPLQKHLKSVFCVQRTYRIEI